MHIEPNADDKTIEAIAKVALKWSTRYEHTARRHFPFLESRKHKVDSTISNQDLDMHPGEYQAILDAAREQLSAVVQFSRTVTGCGQAV
jgi:hypothetical protein